MPTVDYMDNEGVHARRWQTRQRPCRDMGSTEPMVGLTRKPQFTGSVKSLSRAMTPRHEATMDSQEESSKAGLRC